MLRRVLPLTEEHFARAVVMPNTDPPILSGEGANRYRSEVLDVRRTAFEPLMTIKITPATAPAMIYAAKEAGVIAGKLYPAGVTTGADIGGVMDFRALWSVFRAMEESAMVLCLHGELPESSVLDREKDFLPVLAEIAGAFPALRVVMEHLSTAEAVAAIGVLDNVGATITAHHLLLTIDDVLSDRGLRPHYFCKPLLKTRDDRDALIQAAVSDPKVFFGSDSAPHLKTDKESERAPAGIFSAPVALSVLATVFERFGALEHLEAFTSTNGPAFYGMPSNHETLELVKEEWTVPPSYAGIVPLCGGETLPWRVASRL